MLKAFVVVVIVFSVIGSIILFFCWDNHVGFGVIACWGCLVLVAFFLVCGSVVLLVVFVCFL